MIICVPRMTLVVMLPLLVFASSCGSPAVVKPQAFDTSRVSRRPPFETLHRRPVNGERTIKPTLEWMSDVDPRAALTFIALRPPGAREGAGKYYVVAAALAGAGGTELLLVPLAEGETPLSVLSDAAREREVRLAVVSHGTASPTGRSYERVDLARAASEGRVAPPLPAQHDGVPTRVYGAAVNFPSHLANDLKVDYDRARMSKARARVFLKYPLYLPQNTGSPTARDQATSCASGKWLGAFDTVRVPDRVLIPGNLSDAAASLDYEVEIAIVMGRDLDASASQRSDEELLDAVAGYALVGETKVRNPQVMQRILQADRRLVPSNRYSFGRRKLDKQLGIWDAETCQWWSYAAGAGDVFSIGPFFVASGRVSSVRGGLSPRTVLTARTYGDGRDVPAGRARDRETYYVRQLAVMTDQVNHPDRMIWSVADVIRSILEPQANALEFARTLADPPLRRGDIICLGTPGGTVLTSRISADRFDLFEHIAFWMKPADWYRKMFGSQETYLREGDEVVYWGEGLGLQRLQIDRSHRELAEGQEHP